MAPRNRRIEKRRAKRNEKKREKRVATARYERHLESDAHPIHACTVNKHWRDDGQASILLARRVGPGRVTLAAFLVDLWAMGLKDAWGRTDIPISEFEDMISRHRSMVKNSPLNVEVARHIVYGGIELARDLGFRLPRRYERWTAILGPLSAGETPDMSLFLCDGKIRLICGMRDLEARLIGTTPEKFLRRPDVEWLMGDDDFTLVDEDEDAFGETIEQLEDAMLDAVKQWCFAQGQAPHPLLPAVVGAVVEAMIQGAPPDLDLDEDVESLSEEQRDDMMVQAASFLSATFHDDPAALDAALAQFDGFMQSMGSPQELFASLGLGVD